ncbi:type VI secretion system Vgr family protein [Paraburkholderia tagetis]|uniref:Type VI secretion system tip protein VgrG n=1 Tax=Paraburkholderia tagetis TaxID=2913261 RepID=A0A9X1RRS5_9BURK|nr:type VI secretion system tip protein TssI/VgrG [Paraburkholderia tagetis]MCG5077026.1 type VI secretion system tip protein VgrG [Paraburkholderia tagetis]
MMHNVTAILPPGFETLSFRSLRGTERLSTLYTFDVEMVSPSASLDLNTLTGKPLNLAIATPGAPRYLGGHIVRCAFAGRETDTSRSYVYALTLRPWLWYLTRTVDSRIFQNLSAPDIVRQVLQPYGFTVETRLAARYRTWDYCVQYQESDFAFVSRMMEREGIYYYFRHEADQQVLVLIDDIASHDPLGLYPTLPWLAPERLVLPGEVGVEDWSPAVELRSGVFAVNDHDFRKPRADVSQRRANPLGNDHASYAKYDWQAGYINADEGERYATVRLEEEQAGHAQSRASTHARTMAPGYIVTLEGCPRSAENVANLIVAVTYRLQEGGYASGSSEASYDFDFVVQPTSLPWRAPSITPVPRATGPQTAVVVGPAGETIWTDEYGRVKLQFRWDRYGQGDENSSCWVRVSSAWAGTGFGALQVPRIGQEVVVDFLNGELDRPLVTGRIYNAEQMPPFALPGAATQSGIVTRTPGGTTANASMLRFEDKTGAEQVMLHAERNLDISVENDASHTVGANQTTVIDGDSTTIINGSSYTTIEQDSITTINGDSCTTINGDSCSTINGNTTSLINGNSGALQNGNVAGMINGTSTQVVVGNSMIGTVGSQEILSINQLIASVVMEMVSGLQTSAVGVAVGAVGTGIQVMGCSMSQTAFRLSNTHMAVDAMDMSVNHVGCHCTY